MTKKMRISLAAPLAFAASAAVAETGFNLSIGADYAEGKYGTPVTSRQWTFPIVAKYETDRWNARVTVPYVHIENPAVSRDGTPLPCANDGVALRTVDGFADIVVAGSVAVYDNRTTGLLIEATGKAKLATGDEAECLGTGETDYMIQADFAKDYGAFAAFGTLGWRRMGDPPDTNFKDPFYLSIGGSYKLTPATSVGLAYDYRQKLLSDRDPLSEMTVFLTQRFSNTFRMQGYIVTGFSDSSPDWALGAIATWAF
jgi:hypothetical protein